MLCPSLLGLPYQNTIDWMSYKQQKLISYTSGGWKAKIGVSAWLDSDESPLLGCRQQTSPCVLTWGKGQGISVGYFLYGLHPHDLSTSQRPHQLIPLHCPSGFKHTHFRGLRTFRSRHSATGAPGYNRLYCKHLWCGIKDLPNEKSKDYLFWAFCSKGANHYHLHFGRDSKTGRIVGKLYNGKKGRLQKCPVASWRWGLLMWLVRGAYLDISGWF